MSMEGMPDTTERTAHEMIQEMTGGSDKLERFGRGYDAALNMYKTAVLNELFHKETAEMDQYREIFSQLHVDDKKEIEEQARVLVEKDDALKGM